MFLETFLLVVHFLCTVLFQRRKTNKKYQKSKKNVVKNLFLLFEIIAREQVDTQGRLACWHVSAQDTLAREHMSTQDALAREHVRHAI